MRRRPGSARSSPAPTASTPRSSCPARGSVWKLRISRPPETRSRNRLSSSSRARSRSSFRPRRPSRPIAGRPVMFNASPAPADAAAIPDALWSTVDVLLVNGAEAERLSGMPVADVPAAVMVGEALRRRFGIPTVIITLGGRGAVALDERGTRHLPSGRCRSSRPSARGCVRRSPGQRAGPRSRARRGPLAGQCRRSLAVTRPGAHDALPTGAQIRAFFAERQERRRPRDELPAPGRGSGLATRAHTRSPVIGMPRATCVPFSRRLCLLH